MTKPCNATLGVLRRSSTIFVAAMLLVQSGAEAHGGDASAFKATAAGSGKVIVSPEVQRALGITVQTVNERPLPSDLSVSGQVEALPSKTVEINAPVAGRILRLSVQRGAAVSAGQEIAVLDSPEIRTLGVEADRTRAQSQSVLDASAAKLGLAQSSLRRQKTLLDEGISARKDYDVALADVAEAQALYAGARSQTQLAGSALSSRLSSLGQSGVRATAGGTIVLTSPSSGTVVDQTAASGESVEAGKTLVKIVDTDTVAISGQVYEKDLARVRVGQAVTATVSSYPGRSFSGTVASIDPSVDPQTRTVAVRTTINNVGRSLKPQMFATVHLFSRSTEAPAIAIPQSAILDQNGQQSVFVRNGDAFQSTTVKTGRTSGSLVEIVDGLYPGDRVVTQRAFQLRAEMLKGPPAAADDHTDEAAKAPPQASFPVWMWLALLAALALAAFFVGRISARRRFDVPAPAASGPANGRSASPRYAPEETRHPR